MPEDTVGLRKVVLTRFLGAFVILALVLFLPAGSLGYWQAWVYLGVLFVPLVFVVAYFLKRDPGFLERRMRVREKEKTQKRIQVLGAAIFFLGFLVPGVDHRFGWSSVPVPVVLGADAVVFFSYLFIFLVFRENSYASRVIEVEAGQQVIATGPYALVRHPMYLGVILMFLATPLALGSFWALAVFIMLPVFLIIRIRNEEEVLIRELPGYEEYCRKVKYRLFPLIW